MTLYVSFTRFSVILKASLYIIGQTHHDLLRGPSIIGYVDLSLSLCLFFLAIINTAETNMYITESLCFP